MRNFLFIGTGIPHTLNILLLLALYFSMPVTAAAQEYVIDMQEWQVANGLSHREVNCIFKDKEGFLWLGTPKGLNRFDGYNFKVFQVQNAHLPFDNIWSIAQDADGRIWMRTNSGTNNICILNPVTGKPEALPTQFTEHFDYLETAADGLVLFGSFNTAHWYTYHPEHGLKKVNPAMPPNFTCRAYSESNMLWFTNNKEEYRFYTPQGKLLNIVHLPTINTRVFSDYSRITKVSGLTVQDYHKNTTHFIDYQGHTNTVFAMPHKKDVLLDYLFYTGTDSIYWRQGRLFNKNGQIHDFTIDGHEDLAGHLRAVYPAGDGSIWIGGSYGLYKISITRGPFCKILYLPNIRRPKNSYRGIYVHGNVLYAGNEEFGLYAYNLKTKAKKVLFDGKDYKLSRFYRIIPVNDNSGDFLFAASQGIYRWRIKQSTPELIAQCGEDAWSMVYYNNDTLLVGTEKGLRWVNLKTRQAGNFSSYGQFTTLAYSNINDIKKQPDGSYLLSTTEGLFSTDSRLNVTGIFNANQQKSNLLPSTLFYESYTDAAGICWLATPAGLIKWNRKQNAYKVFNTAKGFSNNVIYSIQPVGTNQLWLSSDYGIMLFNKNTESTKVFLAADGLSDNEFNRISSWKDNAGTLYFGGLNGITAFNPQQAAAAQKRKNKPAPLVVTRLLTYHTKSNELADNTANSLQTGSLELNPGEHFFNVQLSLLNFADPDHTTYYYKIDGVDTAWRSQNTNTIHFGSFPYGRHRVRFRAVAGNGISAANEVVITVFAPQPVYYRTWFIITMALLLAAIGVAWFLYRTRKLARDKERLEKVVNERTAELKTLLAHKDILMKETHHRVKNNLQVISALQQMQASRSADPMVKQALEESQNRVLSIAFIHHNLYQQSDYLKGVEMNFFLKELTEHIAEVFARPGLTVNVAREVEQIFLDIDTAVPLGLIMNELLTNSYKYAFTGTSAGNIAISLASLGEGRYSFTYNDNGPGLPQGTTINAAPTLGLRLVKRLSRQLNGLPQYHNHTGFNYTLVFEDYEARNNENR